MTPIATTTCSVLDATTTQCVQYGQTVGSSTPEIGFLPYFTAGDLTQGFFTLVILVVVFTRSFWKV